MLITQISLSITFSDLTKILLPNESLVTKGPVTSYSICLLNQHLCTLPHEGLVASEGPELDVPKRRLEAERHQRLLLGDGGIPVVQGKTRYL